VPGMSESVPRPRKFMPRRIARSRAPNADLPVGRSSQKCGIRHTARLQLRRPLLCLGANTLKASSLLYDECVRHAARRAYPSRRAIRQNRRPIPTYHAM
jgi:hypothetical protein